jgi:hypothetical protein
MPELITVRPYKFEKPTIEANVAVITRLLVDSTLLGRIKSLALREGFILMLRADKFSRIFARETIQRDRLRITSSPVQTSWVTRLLSTSMTTVGIVFIVTILLRRARAG